MFYVSSLSCSLSILQTCNVLHYILYANEFKNETQQNITSLSNIRMHTIQTRSITQLVKFRVKIFDRIASSCKAKYHIWQRNIFFKRISCLLQKKSMKILFWSISNKLTCNLNPRNMQMKNSKKNE